MGKQNITSSRIDEAFAEIVRITREVSGETSGQQGPRGGGRTGGAPGAAEIGCAIKRVPPRLSARAAEVAARINPANAVQLELALADGPIEPDRLTLATSKYWGPEARQFTVNFVDNPSRDLRARIVSHLNAWSQSTNKTFVETAGAGEIRIAFEDDGYWSYLGTDVLLIPGDRQTMNLQGFTVDTSDAEFRRVVRHEAGHTLGFVHEHMRRELVDRIDRQKAYDYFLRTQGWSPEVVDSQVLTPLDERSIRGTTNADQDSIMCYRLPGSITKDGQPIRGGSDINATDHEFAASVYPKSAAGRVRATSGGPMADDDWGPERDVALPF